MGFPQTRCRRTRENNKIRNLVSENFILPSQLVLPIFIKDGNDIKEKIPFFDEVFRYSIDSLSEVIERAIAVGVRSFALFPYVKKELKDDCAKEAYNPENLICKAIRYLKNKYKEEIVLICDVALDPYTIHGHDGILKDGKILNGETIEILCKQAIVQAAAGCDIVAPSDMMDGRVLNIRNALDISNLQDVIILSYAAKYASYLYSPFRSAVGSKTDVTLDKRSYQMDFRNSKEALKEIELDIKEGADIIMVKPATLYLDIINQAKSAFNVPIFAYQVSGEYKMLKTTGGIELVVESLIAIKRAGATSIFCYGAVEVASYISGIQI